MHNRQKIKRPFRRLPKIFITRAGKLPKLPNIKYLHDALAKQRLAA